VAAGTIIAAAILLPDILDRVLGPGRDSAGQLVMADDGGNRSTE